MQKPSTLYHKLYKSHSGWSSFVCFSVAIMGRKVGRMKLSQLFHTLVSKGDYVKSETDEILAHLLKLTNEDQTFEESKICQNSPLILAKSENESPQPAN